MISDIPLYKQYVVQHLVSTSYVVQQSTSKTMSYREKSVSTRPIVYAFNGHSFVFNYRLNELVGYIKSSEKILDLNDNWDGDGNTKISSETWSALLHFFERYANNTIENFNLLIDIPVIYPSLEGSIDIDWEKESYGLILNIEKNGTRAHFYSDYKNDQNSNGVFNPFDFNPNSIPLAISI